MLSLPVKQKKTGDDRPQRNLALRIVPMNSFLGQHGRKITFYSNNSMRTDPYTTRRSQIPLQNFVEFPEELNTLRRARTYNSYTHTSTISQDQLMRTIFDVIGTRHHPTYYQPRIVQLFTSSTTWGPRAQERLLKYSARLRQYQTSSSGLPNRPIVDHVLCSEFVILCYQLAFQNELQHQNTAPNANRLGRFIELDARASGPWNLGKYLNSHPETWTKYIIQQAPITTSVPLQQPVPQIPQSNSDLLSQITFEPVHPRDQKASISSESSGPAIVSSHSGSTLSHYPSISSLLDRTQQAPPPVISLVSLNNMTSSSEISIPPSMPNKSLDGLSPEERQILGACGKPCVSSASLPRSRSLHTPRRHSTPLRRHMQMQTVSGTSVSPHRTGPRLSSPNKEDSNG